MSFLRDEENEFIRMIYGSGVLLISAQEAMAQQVPEDCLLSTLTGPFALQEHCPLIAERDITLQIFDQFHNLCRCRISQLDLHSLIGLIKQYLEK